MHCTQCGTSLPVGSRFCAQCGAPVADQPTPLPAEAPPARLPPTQAKQVVWESKNYQVPLDIEVSEDAPSDLKRRYDEIVGSHLYLLAKEGWEADGPYDLRSMREAGRLRVHAHVTGFLGMGGRVREYKHVVIRIKRRAGG